MLIKVFQKLSEEFDFGKYLVNIAAILHIQRRRNSVFMFLSFCKCLLAGGRGFFSRPGQAIQSDSKNYPDSSKFSGHRAASAVEADHSPKIRMSGAKAPLPHSLHGVVLKNGDYSPFIFLPFILR